MQTRTRPVIPAPPAPQARRAPLALLAALALMLSMLLPAFGGLAARAEEPVGEIESRVMAVENAFARSMADRDHEAFVSFLSQEAVFLGPTVLRGKQAVADAWKPFFDGDTPPFSWAPETVEVLESGNLALSTGPVYDPEGKQVAIFTSIWRQEEPGVWRIVFDRGADFCG